MSELQNREETIISTTEERINNLVQTGQLNLPAGYSASNALKFAWLQMQDIKTSKKRGEQPATLVCSRSSIMQALFSMVVQGLDPVKKHVYFIPAADKQGQDILTLRRSYFGNLHLAHRDAGVTEVRATLIHEGDVFEYHLEQGRMTVLKHEQELGNIDRPFIGGYAHVLKGDSLIHAEIMTLAQIHKAWAQGGEYNPARVNFPDQMAKRTIINRAVKLIVNSSGSHYEDDEGEVIEPTSSFEEAVREIEVDGPTIELEPVEEELPDEPEWASE